MSYALTRYTGTGNTQTYTIGFPFRETADVVVKVDGVTKTQGADYTFTGGNALINFTVAPALNANIAITRTTSQSTRLVDYTAGAVFKEADLDTDSIQGFFMAQEAIDIANDAISKDANNRFDAENLRIINLADPLDVQDAATKSYVQQSVANFNNRYYGESATAPTSPSPAVGDLWYDSTNNVMKVYANTGWQQATSAVATASNRVVWTAGSAIGDYTGSGTTFPAVYDSGFVDVYLNGVKLVNGTDFTATNGTTVVLSSAATIGDKVDIVAYGATSLVSINTVAGDIVNINAVAGNATNINTVATDLSGSNNIGAVASNEANITTVATNSSNINTVAGANTSIGTVATNVANVNTVAGISTSVTNVANDAADIGTVATNLAGADTIGAVASNISNVNTVAGIASDVTAVVGDAADIGTVATDLGLGPNSKVNAVGGSIANVNTVAADISNVNTVAGNTANITAVAGNNNNINTVASMQTNVNAVAGATNDIADIAADLNGANTIGATLGNATNAAASASAAAASESAVAASASAAQASATTASTKASEASASATTATSQASIATTQATNATTQAANATAEKDAAVVAKNAAETSATNAATSATDAATSATAAASSLTSANASATNAATSATNAATSASQAAASETRAVRNFYMPAFVPNTNVNTYLGSNTDFGSIKLTGSAFFTENLPSIISDLAQDTGTYDLGSLT